MITTLYDRREPRQAPLRGPDGRPWGGLRFGFKPEAMLEE
jgi:hypothetical protein